MCVLIFSTTFYLKHFILRQRERDMIKMCIDFQLQYSLFLSKFNKTSVFSTDFGKTLKCKISWKSVQREPSCSVRTDVRDEGYSIFSQFFRTRLTTYEDHMVSHPRCVFINYIWLNQLSNTINLWWIDVYS